MFYSQVWLRFVCHYVPHVHAKPIIRDDLYWLMMVCRTRIMNIFVTEGFSCILSDSSSGVKTKPSCPCIKLFNDEIELIISTWKFCLPGDQNNDCEERSPIYS